MLLGGTTQTKAPQFLGVTFLALIAGGKKEGGGTKQTYWSVGESLSNHVREESKIGTADSIRQSQS